MRIKSAYLVLAIALVGFSCREMRNAEGEAGSKRPSPLKSTENNVGEAQIKIIYSSPGVKDREIWGDLVPYNKIWRTGANDATIFETSADLKINDTILKRGKYSLFTVPGESKWTVMINKVWDQWGAYNYDPSKDAIRMEVTPTKLDSLVERMQFKIENSGEIKFLWERLQFSFLVEPV